MIRLAFMFLSSLWASCSASMLEPSRRARSTSTTRTRMSVHSWSRRGRAPRRNTRRNGRWQLHRHPDRGACRFVGGHCVALAVARLPPFLRLVVSFSHDNPRNPETWIDIAAVTVHPSFPWWTCTPAGVCPADANGNQIPSLTPGFFDIGLVVLATPVTDIKPAKLANARVSGKERGPRGANDRGRLR